MLHKSSTSVVFRSAKERSFAERKTTLRPGFTLVELLVSMALMMFIMVILVEAFGAGMDTFQGLRAIGDLQEQLRAAAQLVEKDLAQDHFCGGRRMSDPNFWEEPRREGFFAIRQGSAWKSASTASSSDLYIDEGIDLDGVTHSYRAADHRLHFSVRLRGNERDKFFYDSTSNKTPPSTFNTKPITAVGADRDTGYAYKKVPGSTGLVDSDPILTSQWGEIAYCLVPAAAPQLTQIPETLPQPPLNKSPVLGGPVPLYNLYRYQYLVIPYTDQVNSANIAYVSSGPGSFSYTSLKPTATGTFDFFSPNDLARDSNRRAFSITAVPPPASPARALVCSNVVSFQVRILRSDSTRANGPNGVYEDLPSGTQTFDTMNTDPGYRVLGVQVILRVWDPSAGLTRQVTVAQDL